MMQIGPVQYSIPFRIAINRSAEDYTVENGAIRISFRQLKGMSEDALKSILSAREEAKYASLRDFMLRTEVNQLITERLIKVGAFDFCGSREALIQELSQLTEIRRTAGNNAKLYL